MEWLEKLNQSLNYIEENLQGKISYEVAAKIACCSTYHYQRMFTYISGVPLSEYIRRRRMTLAAFDLQHGDKVLTVALRYGYESPTSFSRAFQTIHKVTPSGAQKGARGLKAFPRIRFNVTIKGDVEMDYRIEKKGPFKVVGVKTELTKDMEQNYAKIPKFWEKAHKDGAVDTLCTLMNQPLKALLGISVCLDTLENWSYYIATPSDKSAPEGFETLTIPETNWAIFKGAGPMPTAFQALAKSITTEWLPNSGYVYGHGYDIELYLNGDPKNTEFEIWIPVEKK